MRSSRYLLGAVSVFALGGLAAPAVAQETSAGQLITNRVTVDFNVGGVKQTAVEDSDTFVVDRKIDVVVAAVGTSPNVASGEDQIVRQFTVTNLSNATVGYQLSLQTPGDYVPENVVIFIDGNGNGTFDPGEETTFLNALAQDETVDVWVQFDVPTDTPNGDSIDVILVADAYEANDPTTEIVADAGVDDPNAIQTVLADASGIAGVEGANEGNHSAAQTVTVDAAVMSVEKFSKVVWDPVNLDNDPKAIPGAHVEYCIAVTNAAGGALATDVIVNDDLPLEVTFFPDAYGTSGDVMINGSLTATGCTGGTEVDGYFATSTTVNETLADMPGGTVSTLYFTVVIK